MTARGIWGGERGVQTLIREKALYMLCMYTARILLKISHCPCLQASRCTKHVKHTEDVVYVIGASPQWLECYLSSTGDKNYALKYSKCALRGAL